MDRGPPRLESLLIGLGCGALAALFLWVALSPVTKAKDWQITLIWFTGAGYALASLFYLLGSIFTPDGATKLVTLVACGAGVFWVLNAALESTKGTIILGFVILIGIILYGIEAIKREIRKRE